MKYVIADLHFGHAAALRADHRPFADVQTMDRALVANWQRVVRPADEVYILGDLTLGGAADAQAILPQLPGRKTMIRGNHDQFLDAPQFDTQVFEAVSSLASFKENHLRYQLCHYPMLDYPGIWHNQRLLYGHVHSSRRDYFTHLMTPNAVNVSASEIGYTPINTAEIEARITAQWRAKVGDMIELNNVTRGKQAVPRNFDEGIENFDQGYCQMLVAALAFNLLEFIWVPTFSYRESPVSPRIAAAVLDQVPATALSTAEATFKKRYHELLPQGWRAGGEYLDDLQQP